jgi:hypothetical protein
LKRLDSDLDFSVCQVLVAGWDYSIYYIDNGVLLETKTLHPGPGARIFRISPLLVTYEVGKFPHHFHCCCFENTNGLWFVFKTKLTLEIKRKHLKDILR